MDGRLCDWTKILIQVLPHIIHAVKVHAVQQGGLILFLSQVPIYPGWNLRIDVSRNKPLSGKTRTFVLGHYCHEFLSMLTDSGTVDVVNMVIYIICAPLLTTRLGLAHIF